MSVHTECTCCSLLVTDLSPFLADLFVAFASPHTFIVKIVIYWLTTCTWEGYTQIYMWENAQAHFAYNYTRERERERERIPISPIEIIVLPPLRSSSLRLLILFVPSWLRFYSLLLVHVHIYMERITNGGNYPTYIYIYI